ncbi:hypothetical protein Tco_0299951 [Tanacetum coccineum]
MSIQDMEDLKQQYLDEMKSLINEIQIKDYRNEKIDIQYRRECEIKIDELKQNFNEEVMKLGKRNSPPQSHRLPNRTLIMEDKHLDTIPEMESDELIKSSVEDLVHTPSKSDGISEGECDLPVCDDIFSEKDEIDFLLEEFAGELAHSDPIPPGIDETVQLNTEISRIICQIMNVRNLYSTPEIETLKS